MHSFLIDMCRSCLTTNINLKEYMVVKDKQIKCFDAVKIIFPDIVVPEYFGYEYSLCDVCIRFLKSAVIFQRRLNKSHNTYAKYLETLNFKNHNKFSIPIVQRLNKEYLTMLKADKGSSLKQTKNTCNQIPTYDIYFQDTLNDEDLKFDAYLLNDFDNFVSELDAKIDKKENISVKIAQEECKTVDNLIADNMNINNEEFLMSDNDNCNQMNFKEIENILYVRKIKEEPENIILECPNDIDKDILMSDGDTSYQLESKVDVKEHILDWESIMNGEEYIDSVYGFEKHCKNEIVANNLPAANLQQEKTTPIKREVTTSPITLTKHNRDHNRKPPYKCDHCNKSFTCNSSLIRHKHIHTGEQLYKCDVCGKSFIKNASLIVHKRIHTGERPYKCDVCEKSFSQNVHLNSHKGNHTEERPHKCDVCGKFLSRFSFNYT